MNAFTDWLAASPLASFLKVFIATMLSMALATWATDGVISVAEWQTWLIAALVSSLPLIINWLNPADPRYGRGKE